MKSLAIIAAKKAGKYLLHNYQKDLCLAGERGLAKEIRTKYDLFSDKLIIKEISQKYPLHNLLTEESGFIGGKSKLSQFTWVIDPLDGSRNYINGNPFFAVSIALLKRGEIQLGVIYAHVLKELYVAEKGKGAFLNGRKINVSNVSALSQSYLLSCEGGCKTNRRIAEIYAQFLPKVKDLRKLGSAALEAAFVASGRSDAYLVVRSSFWDVAAAILLVKEAGGMVTNFAGSHWGREENDLIFSNGLIHKKIIHIL